MKRWQIFAVLCVLILAMKACGTTRTWGTAVSGATHQTLAAALTACSATDTIRCLGTFSDSTASAITAPNVASIVIDLDGATVTFVNLTTAGNYVLTLDADNGAWHIKDGAIVTYCGFLSATSATDKALSLTDFDLTVDGDAAAHGFYIQTKFKVAVTRCDFVWSSTVTDGTWRMMYMANKRVGSTFTDCTFSGANEYHVYFAYSYGASQTVFRGCTFTDWLTDPAKGAIATRYVGDLRVVDCDFINSDSLSTVASAKPIYGVLLQGTGGTTPADSLYGKAYIDSSRFTGCTIKANHSAATTVQPGTATNYLSIRSCTFDRIGHTYWIENWFNYTVVQACTLLTAAMGSDTTDQFRAIMIGDDAGTTTGNIGEANHCTVTGCYIYVDGIPTNGTGKYYLVETKNDSLTVRNSTISYAQAIPAGSSEAALINSRGGRGCTYYNNWLSIGSGGHIFRFGDQAVTGDTISGKSATIYNNHIGGSYTDLVRIYQPYTGRTHVSMIDSLTAMSSNCIEGSITALADNDSTVSCDTLSWYSTTSNFTDSTSWRMKWGGKLGLTGITASTFGFVNVGINPPAADPGYPQVWTKTGAIPGPWVVADGVQNGWLPAVTMTNDSTYYRIPGVYDASDATMVESWWDAWRVWPDTLRTRISFLIEGAERMTIQGFDTTDAGADTTYATPAHLIAAINAKSEAAADSLDPATWFVVPRPYSMTDRLQLMHWLDYIEVQTDTTRRKIRIRVAGTDLSFFESDTTFQGIWQAIAAIDSSAATASDSLNSDTWYSMSRPFPEEYGQQIQEQIYLDALAIWPEAKRRLIRVKAR